MKSPAYHPDDAHLMDYAAGNQAEAVSLAIATHLTLCPACRREVARFEALGGASLETLTDAPMSPDAVELALKRLDAERAAPEKSAELPLAANENSLPRPLLRLLNAPVNDLSWRKLGGFALHRLRSLKAPYCAYLIRGDGGTQLARHTHDGEEITLILEGGLTDGEMHLERGDFSLADADLHHSPLADPEGCLLLAVVRGQLRFESPVAGLVGRWFGVKLARIFRESHMNAHDFSFTGMDGKPLPLSRFDGKPVLIVNTASACGLTPQYAGLEKLHETYGPRGLTVLGVPCNDFGAQEPGSEGEIKTFCETNYGVKFPLTKKEKVLGDAAHPFYLWAREKLGADTAPKWNFHKYLVDGAGNVASFSSRIEPTATELTGAIEAQLPKKGAK